MEFDEVVRRRRMVRRYRPDPVDPTVLRRVLDTARRVTHGLTEPVVAPIRRRAHPDRLDAVGLDLSVLIAFVAVLLARLVVVPLIPF